MALKSEDPWTLHFLRNVALICISIFWLPLSVLISIAALTSLNLRNGRLGRSRSTSNSKARILVTGVGMAKGLFLARTMYLAGCTVIGADIDRNSNSNCGRFSRALARYFKLKNPTEYGSQAYIDHVVEIVKAEQIDLWISCSGVANAVIDAELARAIEASSSCRAIQLTKDQVSILDDKVRFMQETVDLGLESLEWYSLSSEDDAQRFLQKAREKQSKGDHTGFIIKCASMDDATRGSLPIISSRNVRHMQQVLSKLDYDNGLQWIVQEFIGSGEEYCTHAVVVNGQVKAFTACRSESVLMHYKQLDQNSILFSQMLHFTKEYAVRLGAKTEPLTGHLSFDFLIRYRPFENGFSGTLAPIECNPRCHTATILFRGMEEKLAECYLSVLPHRSSPELLIGHQASSGGYYWMAHDLVALVLLPLFNTLMTLTPQNISSAACEIATALEHLLTWKDPAFEWWDPIPWLVLNHMYWPLELAVASWKGIKWKQLNVSTTKMFLC